MYLILPTFFYLFFISILIDHTLSQLFLSSDTHFTSELALRMKASISLVLCWHAVKREMHLLPYLFEDDR